MEGPHIVVGVDGSGASREALRWAVGLGESFGAEVIAVHAVGLLDEVHDRNASAGDWQAAAGSVHLRSIDDRPVRQPSGTGS